MSLMELPQILINGASLSSIYVLIALGFTLLFGIMRVVNFAHGSFAMLGGYSLYYVVGRFGIPYPVGIPLAALVVAVGALPIEWLVYRRFYQRMFQSMIGLIGLDHGAGVFGGPRLGRGRAFGAADLERSCWNWRFVSCQSTG